MCNYNISNASDPPQHVVFPSLKEQAKRPLTPILKMEPPREVPRMRSSYALFPTSVSAAASQSSSTTFHNINDDIDLPLLSTPLLVRNLDRSDSAGSSATLQIGFRLSYTDCALDPIEALPPSILGLPMGPRNACFTHLGNWSEMASTRTSASSKTLKDFDPLPAQTYKIRVVPPYDIFSRLR